MKKKDKKSVSNWRGGCALPPLILSKLAGSIFRSCCRVSSPIYHFFPRHRFISTLRQLTSRKHKDNSLVCLIHFKQPLSRIYYWKNRRSLSLMTLKVAGHLFLNNCHDHIHHENRQCLRHSVT